MVHIKEPLLLFEKNNPISGSSRFPISLSELPLPYVQYHIKCVECIAK